MQPLSANGLADSFSGVETAFTGTGTGLFELAGCSIEIPGFARLLCFDEQRAQTFSGTIAISGESSRSIMPIPCSTVFTAESVPGVCRWMSAGSFIPANNAGDEAPFLVRMRSDDEMKRKCMHRGPVATPASHFYRYLRTVR